MPVGTSVQRPILQRSCSMPNLRSNAKSDIAKHLRSVSSGPAQPAVPGVGRPHSQTVGAASDPAAKTFLRPTDFAKAQENSSLACLFACGNSAELTSIYKNSSNVLAQQDVMNFAKVYSQLKKTDGVTAQQQAELNKLATSFCKLIQKDGLKLEKSGFSAWYPQVNKTYAGRTGLEQKLSKLVAEVIKPQGGSPNELGSKLMMDEAMPFICQYLEQQLQGELDPATREAVQHVVDRSAMQVFESLRATRSELLTKAGSSNTVGQLGRDLDLVAVLPLLLRDIIGAAKPAGRNPEMPSEFPAADTPLANDPERVEPEAVQAPVAETHRFQGGKQGNVRDSHDVYNITNHHYYGKKEAEGTANPTPVNIRNNPVFNNAWDAQRSRGAVQTDPNSEVAAPLGAGQAVSKKFISSLKIQLEEHSKRGDAHTRATQSENPSIERQGGLEEPHRVSNAEGNEENRPVFRSSLSIGTLQGVRNIRSDETWGRTYARVSNNEQRSELLQSKLALSAKPQPLVAQSNTLLEDRLTFTPLGKRVTESYLKSAFFQPKFNGENSKATSASAAHVLVTDIRGALQLTTGQEVGRKGESFLKSFLAVRNTFLPVNVRDTHEDYLAPMTDQQWGILLDGLNQHPQVADIKARVLSMARLTSIAAPRQWLKDSIVPRMLQWAGRDVVSLTSVKGANDLKPVASMGQRTEEWLPSPNSDEVSFQAQDTMSYAQNVTESVGELSAKDDVLFGFKPWVQPRITDLRLKSDTKVSEAFFLAAIRGLLTPMNTMPMSDVEKTFVLARNTLLPVSQVKHFDDAGLTQGKKDEYLAVLKEAIAHRNVKGHAKHFAEIMLRDTALTEHSSNALINELINALGAKKPALPSWKPSSVILTQDGLHDGRFVATNGGRQ
ncbi:hypothetical protein [Iodobacter fluviatilis]|uniref:Effector protein SipA n=1 Tax=Iodobacter fluviatilis TaxID=537 RepID=A0A377Q5N1_9NEIS|nr:hypothetical protein [Iodobacter fluviatilis]TCU86902.1 invasion protein A [Iodobacter fluviatilis]STQ90233.1 Effector protein SipA [Iodobacter fluviatilis]